MELIKEKNKNKELEDIIMKLEKELDSERKKNNDLKGQIQNKYKILEDFIK